MQKKKAKLKSNLSISHFKILSVVKELNEINKYPNSNAIRLILKGDNSEEIIAYSYFMFYGTLISYSKRKIGSLILFLVRHDYLTNVYDRNTDAYYFKITEKGEAALTSFYKNHQDIVVKKKTSTRKPDIIEL